MIDKPENKVERVSPEGFVQSFWIILTCFAAISFLGGCFLHCHTPHTSLRKSPERGTIFLKERRVFQPSFLRGKLSVFEGVNLESPLSQSWWTLKGKLLSFQAETSCPNQAKAGEEKEECCLLDVYCAFTDIQLMSDCMHVDIWFWIYNYLEPKGPVF